MTRKFKNQPNFTAFGGADPMASAASDGFVADYISRAQIRSPVEEIDAVQVFVQRLVEDYGYSKDQIQTRPQYRVRVRPSDEDTSYPVDIAVFRSSKKTEDELFMVVECKKRERKDGERRLQLYMDMSAAEVGVWFNGGEHLYLRKIHHKDGRRTYEVLPNIPRKGHRIEDIGLFKRKDLRKPSNLKAVFRDLRNHLAGMTTGITRDEALAQEIINLLFCKILDEQETAPDDTVTFRAGVGESHEDIQKRIKTLFERVKGATYGDIFDPSDTIKLDPDSLAYVVGELQNYCIMEEGQFFTPRNVVEMMVKIVDPKPDERVIDPACGFGGFLINALSHVWSQLREEAKRENWSEQQIARREFEGAANCFRDIDKNAFLAKVCKAYMAFVGGGRGGVFCANSLEPFEDCPEAMKQKIMPGSFDVVLTNPPFGRKIVVKGDKMLSQFDLAHRWTYHKTTRRWERTTMLRDQIPPQIAFLERCLELLKPGGRLGIVLPESIFGSPSHQYIMAWLGERFQITVLASMPESLFKTSGKGGTHTRVCILIGTKTTPATKYDIFMSEAKWCGHDSRGNPTYRTNAHGNLELLDEAPEIADRYWAWVKNPHEFEPDHRGFILPSDRVVNHILVPRYYNPEIDAEIKRLSGEYEFVTIGELIQKRAVSLDTGIEIGKMAYGTGPIPFIRTSDISNWEIKADFKHGVSKDIYDRLKGEIDVQAGDILIVKDGTYLIGSSAIVTEHDLPMLFQSHMYRVRALKPEVIDPYLDCSFMFVQMRAMSAYQSAFRSNPALAPLGSRSMPIFSS